MERQIEPSESHDAADRALDRLLAQARWDEPTVASEARLRHRWSGMSRRRPVSLYIGWSLAAAAGVALAVGVGMKLMEEDVRPDIRQPLFMSVITDDSPRDVRPAARPPVVGRPLTMNEKLALRVADHAKRRIEPAPVVASPSNAAPVPASPAELRLAAGHGSPEARRAALREMLARADQNSIQAFIECLRDQATRDEALEALRGCDRPPVDLLLARLNDPLIANRDAAADALAEICDAALAVRLSGMIQSDTNRREALAVLMRARSPAAADQLSGATAANPAVRAQLLAMKLDRVELQ